MSVIYRQLDAAGLLEKYLRPADSASILPDLEIPKEIEEEDHDSLSDEEDEEEDYSNDGQEISDDYLSDDSTNELFDEEEDDAADQEEANMTQSSPPPAAPSVPSQVESATGFSDNLPDDYYDDLFGESGLNFSPDDLAAANANAFLPEQAPQSSSSPAAPTVPSQLEPDTGAGDTFSDNVFDDLFGEGDIDLPYDEQAAIDAFLVPQIPESSPSPAAPTAPLQPKPDIVAVHVFEKQNTVENPLSGLALPKFPRSQPNGYELHLPKIPRSEPAPAGRSESVPLSTEPQAQGEIDLESQLAGLGDILAEAKRLNASLAAPRKPTPTIQASPPSARPTTPQRRAAAQPPIPTPPEAPVKNNKRSRDTAEATPTRPAKAARVQTPPQTPAPPQFDHDKFVREQKAQGDLWEAGKKAKEARKAARARADRYNAKIFGSMEPPPPSQSSSRPPASFVAAAMAIAARASGTSKAEAIVIDDDEDE